MAPGYVMQGIESAADVEIACHSGKKVILTRDALVRFAERYLREEISAKDLEIIAEALDANDSVIIEEKHCQSVTDALFYLSSTDVNGPLTMARVGEVLSRI